MKHFVVIVFDYLFFFKITANYQKKKTISTVNINKDQFSCSQFRASEQLKKSIEIGKHSDVCTRLKTISYTEHFV